MKQYKSFIFVCVFALCLMSCSAAQQQYAVNASIVAVESSHLQKQYKEMEALLRQVQADTGLFTDEEWRQLINVDATIDILITRYETITSLSSSSVNLRDISFMWELAAEGYTQGRDVIHVHWDEMTPSARVLLAAFDNQAAMTSERIDQLLNDPNNTNINQALVLISGILTIAVKMLSIAAL